jgi:hypothetical protein
VKDLTDEAIDDRRHGPDPAQNEDNIAWVRGFYEAPRAAL